MKRIINVILTVAITTSAFAQNSEVTNAVLYHKNNDLDKAKSSIDNAKSHEKTSDKSKTWYYAGLIYMDMAKAQTDLATKHSYYEESNNSFQKAVDLNEKESFVNQATNKKEELYGTVFNEGVALHNSNDLENALKFDELAGNIQVKNPESRVNALINASIAAESLGKVDKGIELNKQILELNDQDKETYLALVLLYDKKDDVDNALKYAEMGANKFKDDTRFTNEVARLAVKSGKADEALKKLKAAAEKDPKNTLYLNKIAELSDKMGNKEEAEKYYLKAVEVEPENVDANYNLGAFYFNKAVEQNNKLNELDLNASPKDRKELTSSMKEYFNKCIPYYEKAYPQLTEQEKESLKPSLMKAYIKVGREDDADNL